MHTQVVFKPYERELAREAWIAETFPWRIQSGTLILAIQSVTAKTSTHHNQLIRAWIILILGVLCYLPV